MTNKPKLANELKNEITKKVEEKEKIAEAKEEYNNDKKQGIQEEILKISKEREIVADSKEQYEKGPKISIQEEIKKKHEHKEKIDEEIAKGKVEYEAKKGDLQKQIADKVNKK